MNVKDTARKQFVRIADRAAKQLGAIRLPCRESAGPTASEGAAKRQDGSLPPGVLTGHIRGALQIRCRVV